MTSSATTILCIGDQHIQTSNIVQVDSFIRELRSYLTDNRPDIIISMGDMLHQHERLHTSALNKAIEYVNLLREFSRVYILVGNHDYLNNSVYLQPDHWLNVLKEYSGVTVIDVVTQITLGDNSNIILCPYIPDGRFNSALADRDLNNVSAIFAHQLFDGAKMGAITASGVEVWPESNPQIISGHIHDRQTVGTNLYYCGSCMQHAFGEESDKSLTLATITAGVISHCDVYLDLPKKKILYMDVGELTHFDTSTLSDNCEYKLTVNGLQEEFDAFKKTQQYRLLCKRVRVVFKHRRLYLSERADDIKDAQIKSLSSNIEFTTILKSLIDVEDNGYLLNMYNELVLGINTDDILII